MYVTYVIKAEWRIVWARSQALHFQQPTTLYISRYEVPVSGGFTVHSRGCRDPLHITIDIRTSTSLPFWVSWYLRYYIIFPILEHVVVLSSIQIWSCRSAALDKVETHPWIFHMQIQGPISLLVIFVVCLRSAAGQVCSLFSRRLWVPLGSIPAPW